MARDAEAPVVALEGVAVRFGRQVVLEGIDFSIAEGERVGIVGPSGAGKSTFLRLVNGAVSPSAGSVTVLGRRLDQLSAPDLRRLRTRIGTIHQHLDLVGQLKVVHNVNAARLGQWSTLRSLWSLVRPQEIHGVTDALRRVDLEDRVFDRTDELSGGQRQRVALARILVQNPDVILADEPVSSLDPELAREALDQLGKLCATGRRTILISLHDPVLALDFCDRLVGLRRGRKVWEVDVSRATPALFRDLYERGP